jgi:hypothetical protein
VVERRSHAERSKMLLLVSDLVAHAIELLGLEALCFEDDGL